MTGRALCGARRAYLGRTRAALRARGSRTARRSFWPTARRSAKLVRPTSLHHYSSAHFIIHRLGGEVRQDLPNLVKALRSRRTAVTRPLSTHADSLSGPASDDQYPEAHIRHHGCLLSSKMNNSRPLHLSHMPTFYKDATHLYHTHIETPPCGTSQQAVQELDPGPPSNDPLTIHTFPPMTVIVQ